MATILLVDDEARFRESLAKRLSLRGYDVVDVDNGEDAIKQVRADRDLEVVVLDVTMPGMDGHQTLKELKEFRPAMQVIMLSGHGSLESAKAAGKADAFSYLEKPCDLEELVGKIEEARQEKVYAMARHEIPPPAEKGAPGRWWLGTHGSRPLFIVLGLALFALLVALPPPERMLELMRARKSAGGQATADIHFGYAGYAKMAAGETVADYYSAKGSAAPKILPTGFQGLTGRRRASHGVPRPDPEWVPRGRSTR